MTSLIHANCLEIAGVGCLIVGDAGAGKSSVCANLLMDGAKLIADDQALLSLKHGTLHARAPQALQRIMQLHGLGIIELSEPHIAEETTIELAFHCLNERSYIKAISHHAPIQYLGIEVPCYRIFPAHYALSAQLTLFCKAWRERRIVERLSTSKGNIAS